MLRLLPILSPVLTLLFSLHVFASQEPQKEAEKARAEAGANAWLQLVDSANYGESWETAAQIFKSAMTKEKWGETVGNVRSQTGKFKSRKLKNATYMENPPNAPAGKYFILQFDSSFDTGQVIETVVPKVEKDGTWKVSGYFLKPA